MFVSTQDWPHCNVPPPQLVVHAPSKQTVLWIQTFPHEPQLSGSLQTATHVPAQSTSLELQATPVGSVLAPHANKSESAVR